MTYTDRSREWQPSEGLDVARFHPNFLGIDGTAAMERAESISSDNITRALLTDISREELSEWNHGLSRFIGAVAEKIEQGGGSADDVRSFNRGTTLILILAGATRGNTTLAHHFGEGHGLPRLGHSGFGLALSYVESYERIGPVALQVGMQGLLSRQHDLVDAFRHALPGMPEGTDRDWAEAGAGAMLVGAMAALQAGEDSGVWGLEYQTGQSQS